MTAEWLSVAVGEHSINKCKLRTCTVLPAARDHCSSQETIQLWFNFGSWHEPPKCYYSDRIDYFMSIFFSFSACFFLLAMSESDQREIQYFLRVIINHSFDIRPTLIFFSFLHFAKLAIQKILSCEGSIAMLNHRITVFNQIRYSMC